MRQELNLIELMVDEIETPKKTEVRPTKPTIIKEYAEKMKVGALFPPVIVYSPDGSERYILADGRHRLKAATEAGLTHLTVDLREGGERKALEYALGANDEHGLRRTNDDKERAILIACKDPEWSTMSNRQIGDLCRVSPHTVAKVRNQAGLMPDEVDTAQKKKDGTPVKQKAKKEKPLTDDVNVNKIDAANRADMLNAIDTIKRMPMDINEAIERLHLQDHVSDIDYCAEYFRRGDDADD